MEIISEFISFSAETFWWLLKNMDKHASLLSAIGALTAAFVALYLGDWKARLERPKLKLTFKNAGKYPYFHNLSFGSYDSPINLDGQSFSLQCPGFNSRVRIDNNGKTTAREVQAKIEKIKFTDLNGKKLADSFYHPTTVKWSGEKDWRTVDIVPDSHYFLDLFWSKNETTSEIYKFNKEKMEKYNVIINHEVLTDIIDSDICPSNEIYWNVWVDNSWDRGIPKKNDIQGKIIIYFIVNASNCKPIRFTAFINWNFKNWNRPEIYIYSK